jgi:hypothetical protein
MDEVPEELSFRTSLSLINDDTPVKHKLQVDECHIINLRSNAKAFYQTGMRYWTVLTNTMKQAIWIII